MAKEFKEATFTIVKARGGFMVTMQKEYDPEEDGFEVEGEPQDAFIIPGDELNAEELGRQIVTSIVGQRMAPKKRR
jgi:hypothetical protein